VGTITKDRVVHIHIPPAFSGEIHVHVDSVAGAAETTPIPGVVPLASSDVLEILDRFETYDPATEARSVFDAMLERGWAAYAPTKRIRKPTAPKPPYVRMVFQGADRDVSAYLNTQSLIFARKGADELAELVGELGKLHGDGSLYVRHARGRVAAALRAVDIVERWANGEFDEDKVVGGV
jgi:hypothetical protein